MIAGLFTEGEADKKHHNKRVFSDTEIATIIDIILNEDDLNGDGSVNGSWKSVFSGFKMGLRLCGLRLCDMCITCMQRQQWDAWSVVCFFSSTCIHL